MHAENADMIDVLQKQLIAEGKGEPYYHAVSRPPVVEADQQEEPSILQRQRTLRYM